MPAAVPVEQAIRPDVWELSLGTLIDTWLRGEFVGSDSFGNRYYRDRRRRRGLGRERRWVLYKGEPEASSVPPMWHAWLHGTLADPPRPGAMHAQPWQRPHVPNLTGTEAAYRPPGHTLRGGVRAKATGDYEPWVPS